MEKLKIRKKPEPEWEFWLEETADGFLTVRASKGGAFAYGVLQLRPSGVHLYEGIPKHDAFPVAVDSKGLPAMGHTI